MATDKAAVVPATGKGKKKGSKFVPLPGVQAVESSLPWHIEYSNRAGRYAVATTDLPAGSLVMVEQPFLRLPISKFAAAVCTRCLRTLQQTGEVPPSGNPCLPRYCIRCKEVPNPLDAQLAALRIKLPEIAEAHQLDPLMLHAIMMMDLQRSGLDSGSPPAADMPQARSGQSFDDLRCSVADYDALNNVWDRKPEEWRKKIGGAVRALHKELTTLADAGTIPGYKASPITRFQADAAQLVANIQQVTGPGAATETGIALFPALSLFQHSCLPNCHFLVASSRVYVRTLVEVTAGTPLTVTYVGVTEPRSVRQATLESERHFTCTCQRCVEPLNTGVDRFVEGVWCMMCQNDVLLPLADGPENDKGREEWKEHVAKSKAALEARAAAKEKSKKAGKTRPAKKALENGTDKKEERVATKEEEPAAEGAEGAAPEAEAEATEQGEGADGGAGSDEIPEGITFWRCCGCGNVQPANNVEHNGPGDIINQAARWLQQGMAFLSLKHADLAAQGEAMLEAVATGMDLRLPAHHHYVTAAHPPLITINLRKGEGLKVMNYAVQLWSADRDLIEQRPSMQQLQCLEAVIDAAEQKASSVNSAVIKRQLEKKVKQAKDELKTIRPVLLGRP